MVRNAEDYPEILGAVVRSDASIESKPGALLRRRFAPALNRRRRLSAAHERPHVQSDEAYLTGAVIYITASSRYSCSERTSEGNRQKTHVVEHDADSAACASVAGGLHADRSPQGSSAECS
jgi:hypothetical protein